MKATVKKIKDNEWIAEVPDGEARWLSSTHWRQPVKEYKFFFSADKNWLEENNMDEKEVDCDVLEDNKSVWLTTPPIHSDPAGAYPTFEEIEKEMKDESQQQVPPGIVAFKKDGTIRHKHPTSEGFPYDEWVRYMLESETGTIHTISVDGIEYSVGETVLYDGDSHDFEVKITSFKWANGMWMIYHRSGNCIARYLTKLAPPSLLDRSGSQLGMSHEEYMLRLNHSGGHHISDSQPVQATINEHDDKPELEEYLKNLKPSQPVQGKEGKKIPVFAWNLMRGYMNDENAIEFWGRLTEYYQTDFTPLLTEQGKGEAKLSEQDKTIALNAIRAWQKGFWEASEKYKPKIEKLKAELTALKSKPTDGWDDTDMKEAFEHGCNYVESSGFAPSFNKWLTEYKKTLL